jgi:hypothetical protein
MATQIDAELARKIAKKLKAEIDKSGSAHDIAMVYHDGVLVASFGIRRGSKKNLGHDHIPGELQVGPFFAKQIGRCPKSREDYLREIGVLDDANGQLGV